MIFCARASSPKNWTANIRTECQFIKKYSNFIKTALFCKKCGEIYFQPCLPKVLNINFYLN